MDLPFKAEITRDTRFDMQKHFEMQESAQNPFCTPDTGDSGNGAAQQAARISGT
jgi:hypothetical protein